MEKLPWIIAVFIAGSLLPIQAGLNTRMGQAIHSPVWASLISFAVGLVALLVYVAVTRQPLHTQSLKDVPTVTWVAGALGAIYVTTVVLAFPKLGPALTFGLIVAGQLIISVALDHFNVLVHAQHSINAWRVLGIALIVVGVVIIRKF
ncbi:MAG: DMT family transporter [Cyclobacteriaceae bacterium]|jgi:transporter family-2 protein|nr:DMT family transporter [Cyclobacteriaceae bacterium]